MAIVATGMPLGICTMESRESMPFKALLRMGMPITGRVVKAAAIPGRCAAPPAPAMTMPTPRWRAPAIYSMKYCGVRCALMTFFSYSTPKESSVSQAADITSQSLLEPMIILTFITEVK